MIQPAENSNANDLIDQIDRLLDELTKLASAAEKSHRPRHDFYRQLLGLVGEVVDADSGSVFQLVRRSIEPIETTGVIDPIRDVIRSLYTHDTSWCDSFFERNESIMVDGTSNACDSTVLLHPVDSQQQKMILAVAWSEKISASSRVLCQGLFDAVAEILSDFENKLAIGLFSKKHKFFGKLHQFANSLSESVDLNETAITVANFGRSLFSAQRVVVLECKRRGNRVLAVSNAATVNRRTDEVLAIESVVNEIDRKFDGKIFCSTDQSNALELVNQYIEKSNSHSSGASGRCVSIIRLETQTESSAAKFSSNDRQIDGSFFLFIEQDIVEFDKSRLFETVELIEPQVAFSLQNAREVSRIPFRRTLTGIRDYGLGFVGSWAKMLAFAIVVFLIAAMFVFERRIVVYAAGELVPESTRLVFAPEEGLLVRLLVVDGQAVSKGESLAEFESKSLDLLLQTEVDEIDTQTKLLKSLELAFAAAEVNESATSQIDSITLSGEIKSVEKRIEHHNMRLTQLLNRKESLSIKSPIDGIVVAWNASETLDGRPMKKGDPIMKIVGESNIWFADIHVDNMDVEHLFEGGKLSPAIHANVVVATKPSISYSAKVDSVAESVVFDSITSRHTVTFRLLIEKSDSPDFKTGASVNAKFKGQNASVFYSWFYRGVRQLQYQYF
jgi:multidrug resistance efflux pump